MTPWPRSSCDGRGMGVGEDQHCVAVEVKGGAAVSAGWHGALEQQSRRGGASPAASWREQVGASIRRPSARGGAELRPSCCQVVAKLCELGRSGSTSQPATRAGRPGPRCHARLMRSSDPWLRASGDTNDVVRSHCTSRPSLASQGDDGYGLWQRAGFCSNRTGLRAAEQQHGLGPGE